MLLCIINSIVVVFYVSEKCEASDDSLSKKRLSPRNERRAQLTPSPSKTLSTKQSQRFANTATASSPSVSRPLRAKVVDSQPTEKSGEMRKQDGATDSCAAEPEKSKDWIYVTQQELCGLGDLVEFLGSLDAADRRVPPEIQFPDQLLANAKVTSFGLSTTNCCITCLNQANTATWLGDSDKVLIENLRKKPRG